MRDTVKRLRAAMRQQQLGLADFARKVETVPGAGAYLQFCAERRFEHIEVLDWTSPDGTWTFIVSRDGERWLVLNQVSNYPDAGFQHQLGSEMFIGSAQLVLDQIRESLTAFQ